MPRAIRSGFNSLEYFEGDDFRAWSLAQDIVEKYPLATTIQTDKIYFQNGAVWNPYGEQMLRSELWHILGNASGQTRINEVVNAVKHLSRTPREDMLGLAPNKVVVKNGIVNLLAEEPQDQFEMEKTGPGTFTRVPVPYDADAPAPPENFQNFLFEVLHRDDVSIMWELIGYCLYRGYPFQKAFMFVGEGANGKSTLLAAIREFLGNENVSAVELKNLAENRFAAAQLDGKLANIAPDISSKELAETGTFKALTGGDVIEAERKYEAPYEFENHATLLFSANRPPKAPDDTYAYERRWIYFDFPHRFNGETCPECGEVHEPATQRELLESFREEHAAILNMAAISFRSLWERGGFEDTTLMQNYEGAHDRLTDPTIEFVKDHMERIDDAYVRKSDALEAFRAWCRENDRPTQGKRHFEATINNEYAPAVGKDPNDARFTAWFGVRLIDGDGYQSGLDA